MKPMLGLDEVMNFHTALANFFAKSGSRFLRFAVINGLPGFVTVEADDTLQTTALDVREGKIVGIYISYTTYRTKHTSVVNEQID